MSARATNETPDPAAKRDLPLDCPKCGKVIRKNQVDVHRFNWEGIVELGLLGAFLAPFFPHKTVEYQCEHCGKIFPIPAADGTRGIRWLDAFSRLLSMAIVLYTRWLVFTRNRN